MNNIGNFPVKEVVPGAGSLVEHIDKKILVWLRDGRMYAGMLRSVDQFANLVLHDTSERIQMGKDFGDMPQGIIIVRGENVSLLGEISEDLCSKYTLDQLLEVQVVKEERKAKIDKLKVRSYYRRGMIYVPEDYF